MGTLCRLSVRQKNNQFMRANVFLGDIWFYRVVSMPALLTYHRYELTVLKSRGWQLHIFMGIQPSWQIYSLPLAACFHLTSKLLVLLRATHLAKWLWSPASLAAKCSPKLQDQPRSHRRVHDFCKGCLRGWPSQRRAVLPASADSSLPPGVTVTTGITGVEQEDRRSCGPSVERAVMSALNDLLHWWEGVTLVSFSHCAQASLTRSLNNLDGFSHYEKSGYATPFF